ncbi:L-arabinose ABC transporter [Campylobacter gastrosuis]|uniref:L-arabinose ABC transporter n=1 Tax=Campylobacter gastrosuis TaxID=2974576 RepID=A0ABT7HM73_9BACT|nr:L-arabinose ABC transporter [Campylobacter gastrosuis]MDL0087822.1 L-arabinose ABC transporter [Campylobacter gastrosuis]MDL0088033.1 L-arabinose ABC transporter [Campylobacter gastrosuis]
MCCFGIRVFLLFFITILSFILNRFYTQIPVVFFYFCLANLLSFIMLSLYFKALLPNFVKENSIHYFSLIGGIFGSLFAMMIFRNFSSKFLLIQIFLSAFWLILTAILWLNFAEISSFLKEFLNA